MQTVLIHIPFTGGIVSPGHLKEALTIAAENRVTHVSFGARQEMLLHVPTTHLGAFEMSCHEKNINFNRSGTESPNIVSSYPAVDIFSRESWLREGVYKSVFDLFNYRPRLKINICDSGQGLVPLFTGHLNWLSSASSQFWQLAIRVPKTQRISLWPELIYTNDIASVSKSLEDLITGGNQPDTRDTKAEASVFIQAVREATHYIPKKAEPGIQASDLSLPYYEGFNLHGRHYWLGIYRRNELFPLPFVLDICSLCIETKIGELSATPWKSLIIKGIAQEHRHLWEYVLGKYRINVRHAANELNWQVEDDNEAALVLKRHIIRHFDKEDVRTEGLVFAVKTKPASRMFGSVIISRHEAKTPLRSKFQERFDILHSRNFDPNSAEYIVFREAVEKEHLGPYLVGLCKLFYGQVSRKDLLDRFRREQAQLEKEISGQPGWVRQCSRCLTVYDEAAGEPERGFPAGTAFDELPDDYSCELCESGKQAFVKIEADFLSREPY